MSYPLTAAQLLFSCVNTGSWDATKNWEMLLVAELINDVHTPLDRPSQ
tara:strand:+ start:433 stop:576 length:144 start_codon:yes stop_codon:yes gene_type:complete